MTKRTGKKFSKQEFTIADTTAALRGVAWESHFNALKEDSYLQRYTHLMAQSMCQCVKSLQLNKWMILVMSHEKN